MGDAGEGLIDAESRIQERMEELERERSTRRIHGAKNAEQLRAQESLASLRLARTELQRQLQATTHARRREQIVQAIGEVDRRMMEVSAVIP